MSEKKDTLISYLEIIINTVKSDDWDIDSYATHMSNDIDEWATMINGKSIDINIKLKPQVKPKYEFKPIEPLDHDRIHDDMLDMIRSIPYPVYSPSLIAPFDSKNNPYYRHCNQLEKHLEKNGIKCNVSRSSVGNRTYYNLDFKMDKTDERTSDYNIKKLLDIKNVGLVDYKRIDGVIYKTILVDEDELDDKYMCCGDLKF